MSEWLFIAGGKAKCMEDWSRGCEFTQSWNGRAMCLDTNWVLALDLQFDIDASGSKGYVAYFAGAWLCGNWQPYQRRSNALSLQFERCSNLCYFLVVPKDALLLYTCHLSWAPPPLLSSAGLGVHGLPL